MTPSTDSFKSQHSCYNKNKTPCRMQAALTAGGLKTSCYIHHIISHIKTQNPPPPTLMISIFMCVVTANNDIKIFMGGAGRRKEKGNLSKVEREGNRTRGHTERLCKALC